MGEYKQVEQTPTEIAERFGLPIAWAAEHMGEHHCLDGRRYINSCLVSDPTCGKIARGLLAKAKTNQ
jgi:hypothetical protein